MDKQTYETDGQKTFVTDKQTYEMDGQTNICDRQTNIYPILKKVSKIFLSQIMLKQFFGTSWVMTDP